MRGRCIGADRAGRAAESDHMLVWNHGEVRFSAIVSSGADIVMDDERVRVPSLTGHQVGLFKSKAHR